VRQLGIDSSTGRAALDSPPSTEIRVAAIAVNPSLGACGGVHSRVFCTHRFRIIADEWWESRNK
jgi:hypothetical protein